MHRPRRRSSVTERVAGKLELARPGDMVGSDAGDEGQGRACRTVLATSGLLAFALIAKVL